MIFLFVSFIISYFDFVGRSLVLIVSSHGYCLSLFTSDRGKSKKLLGLFKKKCMGVDGNPYSNIWVVGYDTFEIIWVVVESKNLLCGRLCWLRLNFMCYSYNCLQF